MSAERRPSAGGIAAAATAGIALALAAVPALAERIAAEDIVALCADADGPAHCGRLVEDAQMKRLPGLARRNGDALEVTLYPSGVTVFRDTESLSGGRTYSLWDYYDPINAVLLYSTAGDEASYVLVHRPSGQRLALPAEAKLSPDRTRLLTADFCPARCVNELALWQVGRDGVRKEVAWSPREPWDDAVATWKDAQTLVVDYAPRGGGARARLERRVDAADWRRAEAR